MAGRLTNKNYIAIAEWMLELPELTNTRELLVFALIYGFTQDSENHYFSGSLSYLSEWLGCGDRAHATRYLNSLVKKNLLSKEVVKEKGKQKGCIYKTLVDKGSVLNSVDYGYIIIQPWMINKLALNGKDLLLYSLVHGYSRMGSENYIKYNKDYFAKWLRCRKDHVDRQIEKAIKKGLIKHENNAYIAIIPKEVQTPQSGNTLEEVTQSGNTFTQIGNTFSSPKVATNNISQVILNNLLESDSTNEVSYYESFDKCNSISDEEMLSRLTDNQYKALNILLKKVGSHEIDSSKESLIYYFKKLLLRDFKTSTGQKIRNIVGYVESNFRIRSQQDEIGNELYLTIKDEN